MTDEITGPTDITLHKYGLSRLEWWELFKKQHGACAVCHTAFRPGQRINVDHAHVKGWNKMAPEQRRGYVRGLLCYTCNKFAAMRGVTSTKAWNLYMYMREFEVRITAESLRKDVAERSGHKPARTTHKHTNHKPDKLAGD